MAFKYVDFGGDKDRQVVRVDGVILWMHLKPTYDYPKPMNNLTSSCSRTGK